MNNTSPKKLHLVGIGGIGTSALAKYYLEKGFEVSGSDLVHSEITRSLKELGAKIFIGPHKPNCLRWHLKQLPDLVIYSPAVQPNNPELKKAKKLGIACQSYPQALGELTRQYFTISVSGTHGKSTTAAMIGLLLTRAGLDPTVILGTKLREFGNSNCRVGKSRYLVIEADEHFASFLNYWPKIIVLTNIEKEHLDYYKNLGNIIETFGKYIGRLREGDYLVANKDDKNINQITGKKKQETNTIFYSLKQPDAGKIRKVLKVPGEHNVSNALAALRVARILRIPNRISFRVLAQYKGSWRRFEINKILYPKPCILISDYGHHPTEIKVTLKAAREKFPKKEIWCVFQPHQYQRTYYLFKDFVRTLRTAPVDKLIITDVYDVAGRENKKIRQGVNSPKLIREINKKEAIYLPKREIIKYLKKNLKGGEVVIIMGAGDIYDLDIVLTKTQKRKKI